MLGMRWASAIARSTAHNPKRLPTAFLERVMCSGASESGSRFSMASTRSAIGGCEDESTASQAVRGGSNGSIRSSARRSAPPRPARTTAAD